MKKGLRITIATLLILPALWLIWSAAQHFWALYTPPRTSFGLHLRYGSKTVYDPWSGVLVLVAALAAFVCGVLVARDAKKKTVAAILGGAMLALVTLGVFSAP